MECALIPIVTHGCGTHEERFLSGLMPRSYVRPASSLETSFTRHNMDMKVLATIKKHKEHKEFSKVRILGYAK